MKENRFFKGMVKTSSLVLCIAIMICSVASLFSVSAAASYKGSGTKADPYLVETVEQLQDIKYNLSAHYKLANTIDLSSVSNFTPIGNLETPFTGTFTCELNSDKTPKYIIKNLKISVEETKDIGEKLNRWECALFGAADGAIFSGIYVFDVKLSNKNFGDNTGAVVYGDYKRGMDEMNTAALVGQANSCTITNCASTGVIDSRSSYSGGLIGYAIDSQISYCYSTVKVSSEAIFAIGGLMGCTRTSIVDKCYSTGNVKGANRAVASLVGSVYSSTYTNCYTTGNATGSALFVTNFTGDRESGTSNYENCYATGTVKGGRQNESANVKNCWTLSGVKSNMKGFKEGSAKDIKKAFSSIAGWDTSGTYPTLTDIGVVADASKYQPNAVTSAPTTNDTGNSPTNSGDTTSSTTTSTTTSSSDTNVLQDFIAAVEALPAADKVTKDNIKELIAAQKLFDQLSETDLIDLPSATRSAFADAKNAIQTDLLLMLKDSIEKLPEAKKIKAKDKENVLYLHDVYSLLTDEGKAALSSKLEEKLLACVKAANELNESETASSNLTTNELIYDIVLSVLVCCAIAFCVFNSIRSWRLVNKIKVIAQGENSDLNLDDLPEEDADEE